MPTVTPTELRARFAAALSTLYGTEVPAYRTLLEVSQEVNQRVLAARGSDAERLGSIDRVTAERHGAIRVGTPRELAQVARIFGALGMSPVGFYDLRDAHPRPIPVVSTAFRPVETEELAQNPFRVFTSMLVPEDRRFFDADLQQRLETFLASRELFGAEVLGLADRAQAEHGLDSQDADRFLELATASFALSSDPVDKAWYSELSRVSDVAADIGGVGSTHINHLTPRVLDIDDLYTSMQARDIEMIDAIQGPPAWEGPLVLLRQTSFRALAEPRRFAEADGSISSGELRVRFGEVEARGIALTPRGRDVYDTMVAEADRRSREDEATDAATVAAQVWAEHLPRDERGLCLDGLGFFDYAAATDRPGGPAPETVRGLVEQGWVEAAPIVYEDFLPRSAAGIFASNLSGNGEVAAGDGGAVRDLGWLSDVIGSAVHRPEDLYAAQSLASLAEVQQELGVSLPDSEVASATGTAS